MRRKSINVRLVPNKLFDPGSRNVIDLGSWCVDPYDPGTLGRGLMPHPLEASSEACRGFRDTVEFMYAVYLKAFVKILNSYNGSAFNEKYWEIIIGTFLYRYIQVHYERYIVIKNLTEEYEKFSTITLDTGSFRRGPYACPKQFYKRIQSDHYNIEIFTRLLTFFGFNFFSRPWVLHEHDEVRASPHVWELKLKLLTFLVNLVAHFKPSKKIIFVKNSYYKVADLLNFVVNSNFKVYTTFGTPELVVNNAPNDLPSRSAMLQFLPSDNEFHAFLNPILSNDFPVCYLEGLNALKEQGRVIFPNIKPDVVFSANSWHYDDLFKVWAAGFIDTARYVGIQHGGNYGVSDFNAEEFLEKRITDKFWTWGWSEKASGARFVSSASKISGYKSVPRKKGSGILFSSTVKPRYFGDLKRLPGERDAYFKCHQTFLSRASSQVLDAIRFRPYNSGQNPELLALWKTYVKEECVERWDVKFFDSLKNCEIYVCDHIMTTYLESLKLNVPTLILLDDRFPSGIVRAQATPHFKALSKVGIVHNTMDSLVEQLNKIFPLVTCWWESEAVQTARDRFVYQYARSESFSLKDVDLEFSMVLQE